MPTTSNARVVVRHRIRSIIVVPSPEREPINTSSEPIPPPDAISLENFPQEVAEIICGYLPVAERLSFRTVSKTFIDACGGMNEIHCLRLRIRRLVKIWRQAVRGWRRWLKYEKPREEARGIADRTERVERAAEHFRKFNERVETEKISIADTARIWNVYQGEIRDELELAYWEALYDEDDFDIMQQ